MSSLATQLRWGVVGAGPMAARMCADIAVTSGNRVVAVASRTTAKAAGLAASFAARVESSPESLFAAGDVDVVYIASPPDTHATFAIAALSAGKHVLVEKPFATSETDALAIVEAAHSAGTFCMEAMWSRFVPAIDAALGLVAGGAGSALGDVRQLTADFSYPVVIDPSHHLFTPGVGGALLDRAVYGVSLARWTFGEVVQVASSARIGSSGVDEDVALLLTHRCGSTSSITASLLTQGTNEAVIRGTKASVTLHAPFFGASRYTVVPASPTDLSKVAAQHGSGGKLLGEMMGRYGNSARARQAIEAAKGLTKAGMQQLKTTSAPAEGNGYVHQVAAVHRAITDGLVEHPLLTLQDSLSVMRVLDQARACWVTSA